MAETTQTRKMLVTGGAGFIGTHLCAYLNALGYRVTSLDLRDPAIAIAGVEYIRGDVRDGAIMSRVITDVDTVFHLAATVSIPLCQNDPVESYSNNVNGTIVVLEACRAVTSSRKPRFVLASTAAIYGALGDDGRALTEDMLPSRFLSYYAAQKHASEKAVQLYGEHHGVPSLIFRFFNVFGKGQDPQSPYSGVITIFVDRARRGLPITVNGDGSQTRDFVYVGDLVAACAASLKCSTEQWNGRVINIGSGRTITVSELAEVVKRAFPGAGDIQYSEARIGDVRHSKSDNTIARELLGAQFPGEVSKYLTEL